MAMNTHRQLGVNNTQTGKSLEKLSSGYRINRAGDDAAGLAISEKMRGQIRGLSQASRNAQDGISLIQTAEGALNESHEILQRMRELAVQSASDTNTGADRAEIQKEIDQLASEITRISTDTEFNTQKLLNGDMGKTYAVTANAWNPDNMQIIGSDITTGTYTLALTAAGTATETININTAATGLAAANISEADGTEFGSYTLNVTNFNGIAGSADFELIGPDGSRAAFTSGAAIDADLTIGGLTFAFGTVDCTSNGSIQFDFTMNGLDVDLSGGKTVNTTAVSAYAGETLNVGGFQFVVKYHSTELTTNNAFTMNVTDHALKFHIGANADQNTAVSVNNTSATALGINALDLSTQSGANIAITTINTAITTVSSERAKLGAIQNRLEHTIKNLDTSAENLQASESRIRDVDMAKQMVEFTKQNILQQAATAMLAQANQAPQAVLQLLR